MRLRNVSLDARASIWNYKLIMDDRVVVIIKLWDTDYSYNQC